MLEPKGCGERLSERWVVCDEGGGRCRVDWWRWLSLGGMRCLMILDEVSLGGMVLVGGLDPWLGLVGEMGHWLGVLGVLGVLICLCLGKPDCGRS